MASTAIIRPLVLVGLVFAAAPVRAQVIPPGQEAVLAAMLGSGVPLPGGCTFADGQVERRLVRATYRCPSGDVVLELSHRNVPDPHAIRTERFALSVVAGPPPPHLVDAVAALVRAGEGDFDWSLRSAGGAGGGLPAAVFRLPAWCFGLLLSGMAIVASISGWRAWSARGPMARRAALEAVIVAVVVVVWLQVCADPPAHGDTAVDLALARDCMVSRGGSCFGHAASAIGLVQGQGFTYALAVWLSLGLSMHALCSLAACVNGAAIGLLHYATSRRFDGVAWIVSAAVAGLAVDMTGYPIIWNPSWFLLPLAVAFVATLAIADGSGIWSAFVAGVGFAIATESHILFGTIVGAGVAIALATGRRGIAAATILLGSFVLAEIVISPMSTSQNAVILAGWLAAHAAPAAGVGVSCVVAVPALVWLGRRLTAGTSETREGITAAVWLLAGVTIGLVLPWAVSRPAQIRYYGAAFPAGAFAGAWLLDAATMRARSALVRAVSMVAFGVIFFQRTAKADFATATWFVDDGTQLATTAGLLDTSALDIQMSVRSLPTGPLDQVTAAFAGTAGVPAFPTRIVRAVRPRGAVVLPDGWARIPGAHGDMWVGDIVPWAHPEEAEVCPEPATGEPCLTLTRGDFEEVARDADGAVHRVFGLRLARSATQIGTWARHGTEAVVWRIPVRAAGADDARDIVFCEGPGEHIVAVDGAAWTAPAGTRASIARPAAAASISVRTPIAGKYEAGVPPMPLELRADEAEALRELLPR